MDYQVTYRFGSNGVEYINTGVDVELPFEQVQPKNNFSGKFDIVRTFSNGTTDVKGYKTVYIKKVIYNNPATIVIWSDEEKTVVKCAEGDVYNKEVGLILCILKRFIGGANMYNLLKEWVPENSDIITLKEVRQEQRR